MLRVPGLKARALPLVDAHAGDPVAILGYPVNGPFDARPGRIGNTADVLVEGSLREVTALSGLVRHGNSGGPVVNRRGQVEATVFAARIGSRAGYGVPAAPVRRALARAKGPSRPAPAEEVCSADQLEHASRPLVRRDDVDARAPPRAAARSSFACASPSAAASRPGGGERVLQRPAGR